MDKRIAHVVVGLPVDGPFDYFISPAHREKIAVGSRIWVLFRNQRRVGYVVSFAEKTHLKKINPVLSLIDETPVLDAQLLELTRQMAEYYICSWGEAIEGALPELLRKGKPAALKEPPAAGPEKAATTILAHDPTGKLRWAYLAEKINAALKSGLGVVILVPEVARVAPTVQSLKEFVTTAPLVWDKSLSHKDECENWIRIKNGEAHFIIGSRSAVFAPVRSLGLLIIDDEENSAYKQEQGPFYHSRQTALFRCEIEGAVLILASAVPSAEAWFLKEKEKAEFVLLSKEKLAGAQMLDLENYKSKSSSYISFPLRNQIEKTLLARGKVLLLMNRRGFNLLTRCSGCGYTFQCPRCNVNLASSYAQKKLVCRLCNFSMDVPSVCPQCHKSYLESMGRGIEKLESEAARIFPQARLGNYDKDSQNIPSGFDILIATQAVLRVKDRLNIQTTGVISIDAELNRYDFRSGQRTFALLVHLRQMTKDKLFVQTRLVDHYCVKAARDFDFEYFYKEEMALRKELGFPPFRHAVAVNLRSFEEKIAGDEAAQLYEILKKLAKDNVSVHSPHPDILPKLRDKYRYTIHLRGKTVKAINDLIKKSLKEFKRKKDIILSVNVDP